jgi:RNA polymerase-binding transcription factor DksA
MADRYTEQVDAAQMQQDRTNQDAIDRVRAQLVPETHPDFDGVHCIDGGEVIPPARLALGKIRCVNCQELKERGSQLRR